MESAEAATTEVGESIDIIGSVEPDISAAPDYEVLAKEKGWKPKDAFDNTVKHWVDAETFVKNQPLIDKIGNQKKKLKELEKTVEALAKHYQTNVTQAKERAIIDLRAERREAIELGEVTKVEEIDQKIDHVKRMEEVLVKPSAMPSELEDFLESQKSWFNKDEDMTTFAVAHNESYLKKHPGELGEALEKTLAAVRKAYPEKFENTRKTAAPSVDGATQAVKTDIKYSTARLNNEQKLVYNQLVKVHKQMTHDAYFKSLEDAGFLE